MRQAIDVIRATRCATLPANGPTDKELADAKTYLTGSFPLAFSSNVDIATQLNTFQRSGLPVDYVKKRNDLMNAVTSDDVKRAARRLFNPDAMTVVMAGSLGGSSPPAKTNVPQALCGKPQRPQAARCMDSRGNTGYYFGRPSIC